MLKSLVNVVIASNSDWPVPAGAGTRRYLALDISNKLCSVGGATEDVARYFEQLASVSPEALLYYLYYCVDVSEFKPWVNVPVTGMLEELVERNMNPMQAWWKYCLENGEISDGRDTACGPGRPTAYDWDGEHSRLEVDKQTLLTLFESYHGAQARNIRVTPQQFHQWMHKNVPGLKDGPRRGMSGNRLRTYDLPTLSECRDSWLNQGLGKLTIP